MVWNKKKQAVETERRSRQRSVPQDRSYAYYKAERHKPNTKPIEIVETQHSRVRLAPSIVAVGIIVASIFYSMTLSVSPNIQLLAGQNPVYRPIEEYQVRASEIMSDSPTSYTKFSVNTSRIEQEIQASFPELDAVAVRLPVLGRRPTITVGLRQPALLLSNSTNLFVLDLSGRVVALAKDVDSTHLKGLKNVRDESGLEVQLGTQAVTSGTVGFINQIDEQFQDKNLAIDTLILPLSANQLHVQLKNVPYYIKMDIAGDARLQVGSYLAVRDELTRQGIQPKEYVDVRVEEKVFYK